MDAVERLSPEEQTELVAIVRRRLAERGRQRVASEVLEARVQFADGSAAPAAVEDLIREIES